MARRKLIASGGRSKQPYSRCSGTPDVPHEEPLAGTPHVNAVPRTHASRKTRPVNRPEEGRLPDQAFVAIGRGPASPWVHFTLSRWGHLGLTYSQLHFRRISEPPGPHESLASDIDSFQVWRSVIFRDTAARLKIGNPSAKEIRTVASCGHALTIHSPRQWN